MNFNEQELDLILRQVSEFIATQDQGVFVLNPNRVRDVLYVYELMHDIFRGTDTHVTYELSETRVSLGSVDVVTKDAVFEHPELLLKSIERSSSFEVFAKTDGTVWLCFSFYDIAKKVTDQK